jgi:hypothetical protein
VRAWNKEGKEGGGQHWHRLLQCQAAFEDKESEEKKTNQAL